MRKQLTIEETAELEQLIQHRQKLKTEIDHLDETRKEYDAKILDLLEDIDKTQIGHYKLSVTRTKRLNTKSLEQAYPVAQNPGLYTAQLDTSAVRKQLTEQELEAHQTIGAPFLRVSVTE